MDYLYQFNQLAKTMDHLVFLDLLFFLFILLQSFLLFGLLLREIKQGVRTIRKDLKDAEEKRIYDRHTAIFTRLRRALAREGWTEILHGSCGEKGMYTTFRVDSSTLNIRLVNTLTVVIQPSLDDFNPAQLVASDGKATRIYGCAEEIRAFAKKVAQFLENSYTVG